LKLLLDHNLPPQLATALQALFPEHQIIALQDQFPINVSDVEWINELDRQRGWAVVTRDLRITTRPHERAALDRSRIVYFFVKWRKLTIAETAVRLIRLMPKMAQQVEIAESGRFELPANAGSKLRPYRK
jgi:hypothetical protein